HPRRLRAGPRARSTMKPGPKPGPEPAPDAKLKIATRWWRIDWLLAAAIISAPGALAQPVGPPTQQQIAARNATEKQLESLAVIERKVMAPMRDGKRMAADIYRPKDSSRKYPAIFVRT